MLHDSRRARPRRHRPCRVSHLHWIVYFHTLGLRPACLHYVHNRAVAVAVVAVADTAVVIIRVVVVMVVFVGSVGAAVV